MGPVLPRDPGRDDRLHGDRDRVEPRRGGARPRALDPALDQVRRDRRLRDLLHAAARRALGAAGAPDRRAPDDAARARPRSRAASRTTRCSASSRTSASRALLLRRSSSTSASSPRRSSSSPRTRGSSAPRGSRTRWRRTGSCRRSSGGCTRASRRRGSSLIVFAGFVSIIVLLPGKTDFLGTMYSFGAMLSFTVAHVSVIQLRRRYPDDELAFRARPNLRFRGVAWPLFAFFGGTRDRARVARRRRPEPEHALRRASAGSRSASSSTSSTGAASSRRR